MSLSHAEHVRLTELQAVLTANGGRGVEISEEIDALLRKRDGHDGLHVLVTGNPVDGFSFRGPYLNIEHASSCGPEAIGPDWWTSPLQPTDGWHAVKEEDVNFILTEVLAEIVRNEEASDSPGRADLLADVINRLTALAAAAAPELLVDNGQLKCPHCGALDNVRLVDVSMRVNETSVEYDEEEESIALMVSAADGDHQTDHLLCGRCARRVACPMDVQDHWN